MNTRLITLNRLRSKLLRVRRLSRLWIRSGGESQDLVRQLTAVQLLLRRKQLQAGERELDFLIGQLQQETALHEVDRTAA